MYKVQLFCGWLEYEYRYAYSLEHIERLETIGENQYLAHHYNGEITEFRIEGEWKHRVAVCKNGAVHSFDSGDSMHYAIGNSKFYTELYNYTSSLKYFVAPEGLIIAKSYCNEVGIYTLGCGKNIYIMCDNNIIRDTDENIIQTTLPPQLDVMVLKSKCFEYDGVSLIFGSPTYFEFDEIYNNTSFYYDITIRRGDDIQNFRLIRFSGRKYLQSESGELIDVTYNKGDPIICKYGIMQRINYIDIGEKYVFKTPNGDLVYCLGDSIELYGCNGSYIYKAYDRYYAIARVVCADFARFLKFAHNISTFNVFKELNIPEDVMEEYGKKLERIPYCKYIIEKGKLYGLPFERIWRTPIGLITESGKVLRSSPTTYPDMRSQSYSISLDDWDVKDQTTLLVAGRPKIVIPSKKIGKSNNFLFPIRIIYPDGRIIFYRLDKDGLHKADDTMDLI